MEPDPAVVRHQEAVVEHRRLMARCEQTMAEAKQACDHLAWVVTEIRRQRQENFYQPLHEAIKAMHRCRSRHVATFAVRKVAAGETIWEGYIEEFRLVDHLQAQTCYAWEHQSWGRTQSFSLLKLPPVYSPQSAVQLALAVWKLPPPDPF